jgi:hypothetical protein
MSVYMMSISAEGMCSVSRRDSMNNRLSHDATGISTLGMTTPNDDPDKSLSGTR